MSIVSQIKEEFRKRKIRKLDKQRKPRREFVDIDKAKQIGMIVNINQCSTDDIKDLRKYISRLQKSKKRIFLIELNFIKKSLPELANGTDSVFINPSKLNWLDYPTHGIEGKIREQELDILMDFDSSGRMTSKYVLNIANAKTRTGPHVKDFEYCYELMVELPSSSTAYRLRDMINHFDHFLKELEK